MMVALRSTADHAHSTQPWRSTARGWAPDLVPLLRGPPSLAWAQMSSRLVIFLTGSLDTSPAQQTYPEMHLPKRETGMRDGGTHVLLARGRMVAAPCTLGRTGGHAACPPALPCSPPVRTRRTCLQF